VTLGGPVAEILAPCEVAALKHGPVTAGSAARHVRFAAVCGKRAHQGTTSNFR
jgi:hypothetical protein